MKYENGEYLEVLKKQLADYKREMALKRSMPKFVKCYRNKFDLIGTKEKITDVFDAIRKFDDIRIYKKKNIRPIIQFSVLDNHDNKSAENVDKHSGLIVVDIDKKDNLDIDFDTLKQDICSKDFIYGCFSSPSGGLKVLIKTNIEKVEHHKVYYYSCIEYLGRFFKVKFDTSGSDISRQCYFSYDPNAYLNLSARRLRLDEDYIKSRIVEYTKIRTKNNISNDFDIIDYDDYYTIYSNLIKKVTNIGLYKCIFNKYRFNYINNILLSTSVPFLDNFLMLQLENDKLNFETRVDEIYFEGKDKQEPIYINEGVYYTKIRFSKDAVIKEGKRNKTIYLITLKLIFNNPFVKFDKLLGTVTRLYHRYKDLDAETDFTDKEIYDIVDYNFKKYINGLLDFNPIIRKNDKGKVKPKYVFFSREYIMTSLEEKRIVAIRKYFEGKGIKSLKDIYEALEDLQDGEKITNERIAKHMGISERTIKRRMKKYPELDELKKDYNNSIKNKKSS